MPNERILVVDDDPAILSLCRRILEGAGYIIVDAKRGEEALARLETETFDLLLTDIRLPGLNGLEVAEQLRARGLELTVVTMTGFSNMEMAIQALSLGVEEFLVKPFTVESLRITVARALEKASLRRENMRLRTLEPLWTAAQNFSLTRTREQVYEFLFAALEDVLETSDALFIETSQDLQGLTVAATHGAMFAALRDQVFHTSQVVNHEELVQDVQVWDATQFRRLPFDLDEVTWFVSAPLRVHEKRIGVLLASVAAPPTASEIEALNLICAHAAATLHNVDLLAEISRAYVNVLQLDQVKSEFINIAGHELRTPLAVLHGYASILSERLEGENREYASEIILQATRLQRIADDMLKLKFLEQPHPDLRLEQCKIEEVVRQVVNAYRHLAMEREQFIEMEIPEQTGAIIADRAMLDLMLGSLLSNAIKFSPRQTRVRVAAQGDAQQVTLRVQDEGKGLDSAQAAQVFEPFYQASHSLTRSEGGIGMGLTLAREMVRAHGGKIWVESETNGGSSFYITLPRELQSGF